MSRLSLCLTLCFCVLKSPADLMLPLPCLCTSNVISAGTHDCNPVNEHFYRTAMCQKGQLTILIAPSEIPLSPPISPQSASYKEGDRLAERATRCAALPAPSLKGLRIHIPMKKQFVGQTPVSWTLPPQLPEHPCTPYYHTATSPPLPRYQGVYPPLHAGPFPMTPIEPMIFHHVMPYPMQALRHPSLVYKPPHLSASIFQSGPMHTNPSFQTS